MTELVRLYKAHKERGYSKSAYLDAKKYRGRIRALALQSGAGGRFMAIGADKIVRQTYVEISTERIFP